jgi:hypothetical protein
MRQKDLDEYPERRGGHHDGAFDGFSDVLKYLIVFFCRYV